VSTIQFIQVNDLPGGTDICVQFDDNERPFIEDLLNTFEQFLLAMTFQPDTYKKYIDTDKIQAALLKRAQLVAELQNK
jgi:hypothetical protein